MKTIIAIIITGLCCGTLGFFSGTRYNDQVNKDNAQSLSITELKVALAQKEMESILQWVDVDAVINTRDEGGLFKAKLVTYVSGTITNKASISLIKDVSLQIKFYSKTNSEVGTTQIVVYEYVKPGYSLEFKENLNWPKDAHSYSATIVDVKTEQLFL